MRRHQLAIFSFITLVTSTLLQKTIRMQKFLTLLVIFCIIATSSAAIPKGTSRQADANPTNSPDPESCPCEPGISGECGGGCSPMDYSDDDGGSGQTCCNMTPAGRASEVVRSAKEKDSLPNTSRIVCRCGTRCVCVNAFCCRCLRWCVCCA